MTKIRTLEELQQILDDDLAWRKKDLSIIKSFITGSAPSTTINCHIRSGIALLYAHWEGFIKVAGSAYLTYVASLRLTYSELSNNFIAIAAKRLLNEAKDANKVTVYARLADFFMSGLTDRCNLPLEIETRSNLSSAVLREITYTLGIDYGEYETKAMLIDVTLLKNGNSVAHGKYLLMDVGDFLDLHRTVIELMDLFSNQISNAASTKTYKRTVEYS